MLVQEKRPDMRLIGYSFPEFYFVTQEGMKKEINAN
jgi:hypothetical protein